MGFMDIVFKALFGSKSENDIKRIRPIVDEINAWEPKITALSDKELTAKTTEFRERLAKRLGNDPVKLNLKEEKTKGALHDALDELLPEAFAVVREASKRTTGMRHFDVQMIGGIVLHQGRIAEMKTGEGKTLVATLAVYLNALTGLGVHVVTVNDYLAKRDAGWMEPIYKMLGLTVGVIDATRPHSEERKAAYRADITYGTNNEFGFDYLRDNMVTTWEEKVQRPFYFAIVDEVDSVLIDEARTPLIISGPAEKNVKLYYDIDKIIPRLKQAEVDERGKEVSGTGDFVLDEKDKNVYLTEDGVSKVEELLGVSNLFGGGSIDLIHHVNQALKAHKLFKHDIDYVVQDGNVYIVDEFTGRILEGRRYSDGLHQAIEAKERVNIQNESQTYATITFQNFFRMYVKLSGMTGTAETEAEEFIKIYELDVVVIPTNKPIVRQDISDCVYRTRKGKMSAIAKYVKELQDTGRPVLVGTVSVEMNEELTKVFKRYGIRCEVLNAKNHAREAEIVANAGEPGAVTLATNMAGRGTDIVLGGNPVQKGILEIDRMLTQMRDKAFKEKDPVKKEALHAKVTAINIHKEAFVRDIISEKIDEAKKVAHHIESPELLEKIDIIEKIREQTKRHKKVVLENGGLHVIGTERHESRRIDNQLRGRSGRQGDPGLSVFYLSLEDDLLRLFQSERIAKMMLAMGMEEDEELQHKWLNKSIEGAQRKVEGRNFDIRKHLLEYDDVMNQQRKAIYDERNYILESPSIRERVLEIMLEVLETNFDSYCPPRRRNEWDAEGFRTWLGVGCGIIVDDAAFTNAMQSDSESAKTFFLDILKKRYEEKENEVNKEVFHEAERQVFMQIIDTKWKEHLYNMDSLREGIGLRGYAERNPLTEYKLEGFRMFQATVESIHQEITALLFHLRIMPERTVQEDDYQTVMSGGVASKDSVEGFDTFKEGQEGGAPKQKVRNQAFAANRVGRNDPCPCGSGKKYKHCHGRGA